MPPELRSSEASVLLRLTRSHPDFGDLCTLKIVQHIWKPRYRAEIFEQMPHMKRAILLPVAAAVRLRPSSLRPRSACSNWRRSYPLLLQIRLLL